MNTLMTDTAKVKHTNKFLLSRRFEKDGGHSAVAAHTSSNDNV